ncbi:MAG: MFS transporter [Nocardioides sp.]
MPIGAFSPLRHRDFRLLVTGATASQFGNAITPIALAFAVLDLGGSATELGLVVAVFALAQVVTSLFGGVLGDRIARKLMMAGSALACSGVQVAVVAILVTGHGSIAVLTVGGTLTACLGALSQPSSQAMTRLTVPPGQMPGAVAIRQFLQTAAGVLGYAVAGVLVSLIGPGWSIAIDAATFLVAALSYGLLRVEQQAPERRGAMIADIGDGFREVLHRSWMWSYILMALVYHLVYGGAQSVLGPIVVGEGIGRAAWGIAMGALMAGFMVGSLACLRLTSVRRPMLVSICFLCLTPLFPAAMALSDSLWPIVVAGLLHGFGLQISDYLWDLSIQQHVDPAKLSRVYSIDIVGSFVCRPLGLALTGPVAGLAGTHTWLLVVAAVMLVSELAVLLVPGVRRLTPSS